MPEICQILVLAPGVTSQETALEYRPFSLELRTLLQTAKTGAQDTRPTQKLRYREYEVFPYCFFGRTRPQVAAVALSLRGVPSAIVDCDVYARAAPGSAELDGLTLALAAFHANTYDDKQLLKVPRNGNACASDYGGPRIRSDESLVAFLENDLWGHRFAALGDEHP